MAQGDCKLTVQNFRTLLRDVFAGAVCSVLSTAYCLSFAALIFSGPLTPWLSAGVAVTFLSAAIGATIIALRSSFPFAIAGPDTATSAVVATLVAGLAAPLAASGSTHLLGAALIVMALATGLTGLLLCVLGFTHAGRAIRFVPYPVIGGFLGATGVLMVMGAVQVIAGQRPTLAHLPAFLNAATAAKLAAAIVVAAALELLVRRWRNALILPCVLIAAIAGMHLFLLAAGIPLAEAQSNGWMFKP
ncbi:MAG TPA: SulP family inorganic anion transporter, partial [Rhizomicrobium sp.]|nr:SulP family inorganic anion transporter [Rhizomicrobium sp.]